MKEKAKSKQHRSNLWMIDSHLRAVYDQILLSPLSLLATVSVWQRLSLVWVKWNIHFILRKNQAFLQCISVKILFLGCKETFTATL